MKYKVFWVYAYKYPPHECCHPPAVSVADFDTLEAAQKFADKLMGDYYIEAGFDTEPANNTERVWAKEWYGEKHEE